MQEGTHKETLLPVRLIVDGEPRFSVEARVFFGVKQREVVLLKEFQLVDGESENPRNDIWPDG